MDQKVNYKSELRCNSCNKYYSSKSSLCNHTKKFHNNESLIKTVNSTLTFDKRLKTTDINLNQYATIKTYNCRYCNKKYTNKNSRWSHEQKCIIINSKEIENNKELDKIKDSNKQKELELLLKIEETKIKNAEAKILQLKIKLEQSHNVDNITLKKINKKLMERNNLIKNSTINIQNNDNKIINNYQLIGFGKEEIMETLTNNELKQIMNAKYGCLEKLVEIVHCGKYNQFKNIIITNMNNNYMYKYDDKKGYFVLSTKSEVLNSLVDYRLGDLEIIYNDLLIKNKIDEKTKDIIEKFINKINSDDSKFIDYEGKNHDNYKEYKINEIRMLLFNNQDKISNDISLFLTTNEVDYEPPNELLLNN
jgi:hypothetical protein